MSMLTVNGTAIPLDPAKMEWSLNAVNSADAGRTQSGTMVTDLITRKRKIALTWAIPHQADAAAILAAFTATEHFTVNYFDPLDGRNVTRTFYLGTPEAPFRSYQVNCVGGTTFRTLSFDIIEV